MTKITKTLNELKVEFEYDRDKVEKVKSIPGRKYNPFDKTWDVPIESEEILKGLFDDLEIEEKDLEEEITIEKSMVFQSELETISNIELKTFVKWALNNLPDYFYKVAASSTGKYHPNYALGKGGLVRHTKAAVIIANNLFDNHTIQNFTDEEKDLIRVSLLLHDGVKHGLNGSRYTTSTHPLEVAKYLETLDNEFLNTDSWQIIKECIASHMGEWNYDYKTKKEVLPKPKTEMQKFVHLCDYLASRKCIEIKFN